MMNENHFSTQILQDYALDLLDRGQRRQVEQHTAVCVSCRQALARETAVSTLVHNTLYQLARPAPAQLERMRPALPRRPMPAFHLWLDQVTAWLYAPLRQPVVLAGLLLVLLFGGLNLYQSHTNSTWIVPAPTTAMAATATATSEPTATQTANLAGTAVPIVYQEQIQPVPQATPVVMLSSYK